MAEAMMMRNASKVTSRTNGASPPPEHAQEVLHNRGEDDSQRAGSHRLDEARLPPPAVKQAGCDQADAGGEVQGRNAGAQDHEAAHQRRALTARDSNGFMHISFRPGLPPREARSPP